MDPAFGRQILAFWLIPAEPARSFFRSLISDLATRFDSPVFEPHLTLYVTTPENENAGELLERGLGNSKPHRLSISSIDFSDKFTKTLFVQFRNDMELDSGVGTCGKEGQSVPVGVGQPTLKIEALTVGGTA